MKPALRRAMSTDLTKSLREYCQTSWPCIAQLLCARARPPMRPYKDAVDVLASCDCDYGDAPRKSLRHLNLNFAGKCSELCYYTSEARWDVVERGASNHVI